MPALLLPIPRALVPAWSLFLSPPSLPRLPHKLLHALFSTPISLPRVSSSPKLTYLPLL